MNNSEFCHLHLHSQYSQLDGFGTAENYSKFAKKLKFKYLACTDHGNIDGLIDFQNECDKRKIKPVLGCECYIVPNALKKENKEKRGHVTLLIKNEIGYKNLNKLITYSNLKGFYKRPRIDYKTLLKYCDGLVVMSACVGSFINLDGGKKLLIELKEKLKHDLYLEIMPLDLDIQLKHNKVIKKLSEKHDIKMVATADCHYIEKDDEKAQEVLLAIQSKQIWADPNRWTFTSSHLCTVDEMIEGLKKQEIFTDIEIKLALRESLEVAKKCCDFRIEKRDVSLPKSKEIDSESDVLKKECFKNYKKIFGESIKKNKEYYDRFIHEYEVIKSKNFISYFLIVWELVKWCKDNDIMIGPSRGSVGASLIAYLLRIIEIDPIKEGLLFFRFISEDRTDYPDIDIDFEKNKRHLIKEHLQDIYGEHKVASISNFLTMKSRMVVKDVARVFDVPVEYVERFTKTIDDKKNKSKLIQDALKKEIGIKFKRKYPDVIKYALKLEGQVRGYGQHAAGIVIAPEDLRSGKYGNLRIQKDGMICVNWEKDNTEKVGLLKLDVLGLETLDILNESRRLIKKKNKNFDFLKIDLNDKVVLDEFSKGNNIGVFQFNTRGITELCKEIKFDSRNVLAHVNALYRPGPLWSGMADIYKKRKSGRKYKTINKAFDEITKKTYGIPIYQEQVMYICNRISGMSWPESYKMIKVISKSKGKKELEKFKNKFIEGCISKSKLSKKNSEDLWHQLEEFGGYGFNEAHSVAYGRIGYFCQYLKVYYPAEFICSCLTFEDSNDKNKTGELIKEANRIGLKIIPPKVGKSDIKKWLIDDDKLRIPFIYIKGVAEKKARNIIALNKNKKRIGFWDNIKMKPESQLEKLANEIGCFDDDDVIPDTIDNYFSFKIFKKQKSKIDKYKNLRKTFSFFNADLNDIVVGKLTPEVLESDIIQKKRFRYKDEILECKRCKLHKETANIKPILTSIGIYNVAIMDESPIHSETKKCLIDKTASQLWDVMNKYSMKRKMFHVMNVCRCSSHGISPSSKQINICKKHSLRELKKNNCKLVLAFGNANVFALKGKKSGIKKLNGKTEWIDKYKFWVCWCVHPSYALMGNKNKKEFEIGVLNFVNKFNKWRKLKRVIIAGSRTCNNIKILEKAIKKNKVKINKVISGTANGADKLGEKWAKINNIPVSKFPANWNKYGKSAGSIRNREMAKNADVLIALWDGKSKGTKNMIDVAKKNKLEVYIQKY